MTTTHDGLASLTPTQLDTVIGGIDIGAITQQIGGIVQQDGQSGVPTGGQSGVQPGGQISGLIQSLVGKLGG